VANIANTTFRMPDEMPTRFMTFLLSLRLEYSNCSQARLPAKRPQGRRARGATSALLALKILIVDYDAQPPRTDEPLNPRKPVNRLTCNEIA
jgi:hypothetical protein